MALNYERAKHLKGQMIRFRNKDGEWAVGKVVNVKKDGLEIEEYSDRSHNSDGYGFPFFAPFFFPFDGFFFDPFFFFI